MWNVPACPVRGQKRVTELRDPRGRCSPETGCPCGRSWLQWAITRRRLSAQSGPDASAQSVERVARLSRNVRQPNHVLANEIAGHKAERRPGAGEEWLAATKYDGVEVKSILINKTHFGWLRHAAARACSPAPPPGQLS